MTIFRKHQGRIIGEEVMPGETLSKNDLLWVDLLYPTAGEIACISEAFSLDIPSKEETEAIEESARYWEDHHSITINTYFLTKPIQENELCNQTVTFLLCEDILFTVRYSEFKIFDEIQQSVLAKHFENGYDLICKIFELRVDKDADILEILAKQIGKLRKDVFVEQMNDEILAKLSYLQEMHLALRGSLFDKRLAITALIKTDKANMTLKKNLGIILKDINSLVEFGNVNINVLDNIQHLLSNQVNIEQNKIIKIFTVVTVAMMPPTLISTIYGMNFQHMPELEWVYGYPAVLIAMVVSTILPLVYFKKRKWL